MSKRDWLVAVGIVLCAVAVVACGGSDPNASGEAAREDAGLEFAECMREHGVNMPDPQQGKPDIVIGELGSNGNPKDITKDPAARLALSKCRDKLGQFGQAASPGQDEEFQEQALVFAQCMRDHGVKGMPDPQFDSGGMSLNIKGLNPNSPVFKQAQEACQDKMPGNAPPQSQK
jgi:hypothetical protein